MKRSVSSLKNEYQTTLAAEKARIVAITKEKFTKEHAAEFLTDKKCVCGKTFGKSTGPSHVYSHIAGRG